ncbi:MAG: YihY/virulence factor BrkB family protein [Casimicrobiaceae bacterium]
MSEDKVRRPSVRAKIARWPAIGWLARVYARAQRDKVSNGAAALGFYFTLAIFPAMIFVMALVPYLPIPRVDEALMNFLAQALPTRATAIFADVVHEVTSERRGSLLSVGLIVALWSASTGMYAVMQQLNMAYDVDEGRPFVRARAMALALTLLFGVLVLAAFSLVVLGGVIQSWLGSHFGFSELLLLFFRLFRWVVIGLALLLAISTVYYAGPNRSHAFHFFSPGTIAATLLLIGASYGFSVYTSHFGRYSAIYGSIGAVIILMLWLYIVGLVLLIGAEIDAEHESAAKSPHAATNSP